MQEADSGAEAAWKARRSIMWFMVVVVTADALVGVLRYWRRLDVLARLDAVVFTLFLVMFPWALMTSFRKQRKMSVEQLVLYAYLMLLMSTILFVR